MSTDPSGSDSQVSVDLENVRAGYQAAIALWTYEGTLVWSKFNAMFVAHSVVLAVIGFGTSSPSPSPVFSVALPVAGLILTVLWFLISKRGFDNYVYWILSARELEERHLRHEVVTVSRGGDFADGKEVPVIVSGKSKTLRMSRASRQITAQVASYLIISVFAAIYVLILLAHFT